MAKRYGRNQRRANREMIKMLSDLLVIEEKRVRSRDRLLDEYEQYDQEIKHLLGPDSAFRLVPNQREVLHEQDYMHARLYHGALAVDAERAVEPTAVTMTTLERFTVEVRRNPDIYRTQMRVVGVRRGKMAALYVDDKYIARNGFTPGDARRFAMMLVEHINGEVRSPSFEDQLGDGSPERR